MKKKLFTGTVIALLLSQNPSYAAVPYDQYTVGPTDTYSSIANRAGVKVTDLEKVNPRVDKMNIWQGMILNLPLGHKPMTGTFSGSSVSRPSYTIKGNETLRDVSKKYGIDVKALLAANPKLKNQNDVASGTAINIPNAQKINVTPTSNWSTKADYIIALAKNQFEVPYVKGGVTPWVGFDSSGLTKYVFSKIGISLPHDSAAQFKMGTAVPQKKLRKGDVLFFHMKDALKPTHVGIYIGNDFMINADTLPKDGVQLERVFSDMHHYGRLLGARRFIE